MLLFLQCPNIKSFLINLHNPEHWLSVFRYLLPRHSVFSLSLSYFNLHEQGIFSVKLRSQGHIVLYVILSFSLDLPQAIQPSAHEEKQTNLLLRMHFNASFIFDLFSVKIITIPLLSSIYFLIVFSFFLFYILLKFFLIIFF